MTTSRRGAGFFLTWQGHQRTAQIGAQLNIPVVVLQTKRTGLLRYLSLVRQTLSLLRQRRPAWLIVQSPSYVLAALAVTAGRMFARAVVVDAHNEAVQPFINDSWIVRWLARRIMRGATAVIVTNAELAHLVRDSGGVPIVLPDPLPEVQATGAVDLGPGRHVAVIFTYAPDEPVAELLAAAGSAPSDMRFHLTGPVERLDPSIRNRTPTNVRFTGFLPEHEYWQLLASVDAVMDLTKMPDCLVCGAYEALSAGVPSLLTDNPAGRRLFDGAAVFVAPTEDAIVEVLASFDERVAPCRRQVASVAKRYADAWSRWGENLTHLLRQYEVAA